MILKAPGYVYPGAFILQHCLVCRFSKRNTRNVELFEGFKRIKYCASHVDAVYGIKFDVANCEQRGHPKPETLVCLKTRKNTRFIDHVFSRLCADRSLKTFDSSVRSFTN